MLLIPSFNYLMVFHFKNSLNLIYFERQETDRSSIFCLTSQIPTLPHPSTFDTGQTENGIPFGSPLWVVKAQCEPCTTATFVQLAGS